MKRIFIIFTFTLTGALLGVAPVGFAQSDECLVAIHDGDGATIPDRGTLCQTTTERACVFRLQLCLNEPQEDCTPAAFQKKRFQATGHCGPVRHLQVESAGMNAVCGSVTDVNVPTRVNGKRPGRCTIRAAVRSAKTAARIDLDKVALVCMPPGGACPTPSTTSTTTTVSTTTAMTGAIH
jgi:hypothetical protein